MWNPETMELMPGFWPPKPSRFWNVMLSPLRHYYLHRFYGISSVTLSGAENLATGIGAGDGVLIAPNHSHDSDPHVMMQVGKQLGRQMYFMAAWQVFLAHHGIDGWVMQRFGAFSVDREGCDRRAMRQVFVNLLSNAIKYNVEHGGVSVVVRDDGARVRIVVRDTGPGLSAEQRARLFQPFDRLGAEATTVQGHGLGLLVCRELLAAMEGTIEVDSADGEGCSFTVSLPAPAHSAPSAVPAQREALPPLCHSSSSA